MRLLKQFIVGDIWKLPLERDKTDRTDKENIIDIRNCLACRATLAILAMVFLREDINRKKRFLLGITRIRGGGSTHARIFWPLFFTKY